MKLRLEGGPLSNIDLHVHPKYDKDLLLVGLNGADRDFKVEVHLLPIVSSSSLAYCAAVARYIREQSGVYRFDRWAEIGQWAS